MNRMPMGGVFVLALLLPTAALSGAAVPAESKVEAVTVYRGQALVTRAVKLPGQAGELELVVSDLPAQIVGSSLSASGADGVRIRSVRYRAEATASAVKKEVADLDAQLKDLEGVQYGYKRTQELLRAKAKHLDKLEAFVAPTAQVELSKGVLNPQTLEKVSQYVITRREQLLAEELKLYKAQQELKEKTALLQRKRAELTRGSGRTKRQAVLFVTKAAAGAGTVRLTYLVGAAQWSPAYNVRLAADGGSVTVEYLAELSQMGGEDWPGVKLTLSTATPAMNAMTPILAPMWVDLLGVAGKGKRKPVGGWSYNQYTQTRADQSRKQLAVLNTWGTFKGNIDDANWGLNRLAAEQQDLELNVKGEFVRGGPAGAMAEVLAVSYALPGSMSLPSRSDRQLVQIKSLKLAGRSFHEAIPLLSSYVYRNFRVRNDGALPLLAGPFSAYIAADFVGRGSLPLVARGQEVTIGFGVDTQLRCRRELVDKSDRVSWGSRVQNFHYRLRLENFKDTAADIRLIDRIPASKGTDLKVSLGKLKDKLSDDPVYVRDDRDRGLLRWDIQLAPRAAGAKARQVEYSFQMKYAKGAHIGREAAGALQQMEMEFRKAAALAH